jgi:hypothetical protein
MPRKSLQPMPSVPLQEYTAVPITDPAEIAELEAKIKAYQDGGRPARPHEADRRSKPSTSAELLELARQLPVQARVRVLTELAAQLSAAEQAELVNHLLAQLPAEARERLE